MNMLFTDGTQISETIPFTTKEIQDIETQQKKGDKVVLILSAVSSLSVMLFIAYLIKDNFIKFKYYDYILFICAGLTLFGFCCFTAWLLKMHDKRNWKRDKLNGKVKLKTIIIDRDKTEYGKYITFKGQFNNEKIRVQVEEKDYNYFKIGSHIVIIYLKYSKTALDIIEI
jgi:hypothetical protein